MFIESPYYCLQEINSILNKRHPQIKKKLINAAAFNRINTVFCKWCLKIWKRLSSGGISVEKKCKSKLRNLPRLNCGKIVEEVGGCKSISSVQYTKILKFVRLVN